jgi:hypothetical protein
MFKSLVNEICELYRQGLDESTIASILNMPEDDVALIIQEYADDESDAAFLRQTAGYDDSMDGDFDSGMTSAGYGTDEDYGYYGE